MASYTDEWAADFWRPLEEDKPWMPRKDDARKYTVAAPFSGPPRKHGFAPKQAPRLMVSTRKRNCARFMETK